MIGSEQADLPSFFLMGWSGRERGGRCGPGCRI